MLNPTVGIMSSLYWPDCWKGLVTHMSDHEADSTHRYHINKCCFARILEPNEGQLHLLLPEEAPEPIQQPIESGKHFFKGTLVQLEVMARWSMALRKVDWVRCEECQSVNVYHMLGLLTHCVIMPASWGRHQIGSQAGTQWREERNFTNQRDSLSKRRSSSFSSSSSSSSRPKKGAKHSASVCSWQTIHPSEWRPAYHLQWPGCRTPHVAWSILQSKDRREIVTKGYLMTINNNRDKEGARQTFVPSIFSKPRSVAATDWLHPATPFRPSADSGQDVGAKLPPASCH